MTIVGSVALAVGVAAALLSMRSDSSVARWMRVLAARPRRSSARAKDDDLATRTIGAMCGALAGGAVMAFVPVGVTAVALLGYGGWIAPAVLGERRAARRRRDAERAAIVLVEWVHALASGGRPPDVAVADAAARASVDVSLREPLERVRRDYMLGVPMHTALAREAGTSGVTALGELAARLEQARDLGRGALPLLQDLRDDLRARERSRVLGAAAAVEGKLTAVMTLCYLPALALLVIVPLFVTLLAGLLGP